MCASYLMRRKEGHKPDGFMLEVRAARCVSATCSTTLDLGLHRDHLAPGLLLHEACAGLVLDYHPVHLFDGRRRKEWRLFPPKPVLAVKA